MLKNILKYLFKTLKVLFTVLVIIAMMVIISQRVTNNKLRLFGYGIYTVISESMLPDYEIGDKFLAKTVDEEDINVGDDIVYLGEVDTYKDKVITHRVIRIEADNTIITKGINNSMEDPPIQYKQVYGKVTGKLLVLSLFSKLMNHNALFYVLIFVPFTILIFLDSKDLFEEKSKKKQKKQNSIVAEGSVAAQEIAVPTPPTVPVVNTTQEPVVNNNVPLTTENNVVVVEENQENKE